MTRVLKLGWRFLTVGLINALSLLAAVWLTPGITVGRSPADILAVIASALFVGLVNAFVRPVLVYLTYPVNLLTIGVPTIVIDSFLILVMGRGWSGFRVDAYWSSAVIAAVILTVSNIVLSTLTDPGRQRTVYDFVLRRLGRARPQRAQTTAERGMIFIQIDGLSYTALRGALRTGCMPALQELLDGDSHRMLAWDCGIPSQTSSVQAGIMYGDNFDIPAFRWFDRRAGRVMVSNRPDGARTIDERCRSDHRGLLQDGSSVSNLLTGDARTNILTIAAVTGADRPSRRIEDFLLFLLNPYCMLRVAWLVAWDLSMEYVGAWRQRLRKESVQVSRRGFYPFFRIMSNVILREVSTYLVLLDIMRGVPAIYVTYLGYDEVAHYAGPASPDTRGPLAGIDNQIRRIRKIVGRDAPIPYDPVILSDHGQTPSVPFVGAYGQSVQELVKSYISGDLAVSSGAEEPEIPGPLIALLEELREAERLTPGRLVPRAIGRGRRALQRYGEMEQSVGGATQLLGERESGETDRGDVADVLVLCSGSIAHLYLERRQSPLSLEEIEYHHPLLVTRLAQHAGVGFVAGRSELRGPLAISGDGFRQLETGLVVGEDPLAAFGESEQIARHLLRLMRFPNAGDVVMHGLFREGRVVTFEEHIGSHGGLGGAQTQPFLIYPADMAIDASTITNAVDLYPLLRARRDAYELEGVT